MQFRAQLEYRNVGNKSLFARGNVMHTCAKTDNASVTPFPLFDGTSSIFDRIHVTRTTLMKRRPLINQWQPETRKPPIKAASSTPGHRPATVSSPTRCARSTGAQCGHLRQAIIILRELTHEHLSNNLPLSSKFVEVPG